MNFLKNLNHDPIPPLLESGDEALIYFTRRDLLGEDVGPVERLWNLPGAVKILKKQQPDGSWLRPGENKHEAINHALIETWRQFRFLIERYGMTRAHPQVERAAEFIFSCQTEEGDIRGFLANQYATYYTGAVMALLIQAGYADDPRIEKGFQWLLGMRQDDGGWSIPMITHKLDRATQYRLASEFAEPLQPDRTKPFSHHWTGMVLRAFAVHPTYRLLAGGACGGGAAEIALLPAGCLQLLPHRELLAALRAPLLVDEPADRAGFPGAHGVFRAGWADPQGAGLDVRAPGAERVMAGFLYGGGKQGKGDGGGEGKEAVGELGDMGL